MLSRRCFAVLLTVLLLTSGRAVGAQLNRVRITTNPALMRITTAIAGSQPAAVTNSATTYNVRVLSGGQRKITGRLNANMPPGTTLEVTLAAPTGANALGPVTLDVADRDLVTAIPVGTNQNPTITYRFSATVTAGVIPSSTRTVTYTLANYP